MSNNKKNNNKKLCCRLQTFNALLEKKKLKKDAEVDSRGTEKYSQLGK
jgi:hypothetical protein